MKTAYPQYQGTTKIRLYSNIPFDNTYKNHSLISNKFSYNNTLLYTGSTSLGLPKERFLNRRVFNSPNYYYPRYDLTGEYNFDFSNGLICSVVLELTAEQTNANYMRVESHNDGGSEYYYYFITGITQINADTYRLSLELDVLMTYQDEFLNGMEGVPVFTERKHCHRYTNDGLYPHCADYKTGDSVFANVKPSIVEDTLEIKLKGSLYNLKDLNWLYICVDGEDAGSVTAPFNVDTYYKFKDTIHPLSMMVIPIGCNNLIFNNGSHTVTINNSSIVSVLHNLVGSGKFHACKLSPYPPFISSTMTVTKDASNNYTITDNATKMVMQDQGGGVYAVMYTNDKTKIYAGGVAPANYLPTILEEYTGEYETSPISLSMENNIPPIPTSTRHPDPKLLFAPFKKYLISASYGDGYEFYPELIYSDGVFTNDEFDFTSIYTSYIGDYNISTYLNSINDDNNYSFYEKYKQLNLGLSCNVNYNIPTGQDALQSFNLTQSQTFYQSKIASGISSTIAIGGGIASIVIGAGMTAGSGGSLSPMGVGMVAGGVTSIAGGVASGANAIKSTTAKIEDLKNTPDSINVQGSCYVNDIARYSSSLPYVVIYGCSDVVKENANDYFYQYGYEVSRDCYFNVELKYNNDTSHIVDNNLFGRDIFNYIKTNDDLTNKINENMPLIVKQKLSSIFNNGITLWCFFGKDDLWGNVATVININYLIDNWFMKHDLDNSEIDFSLN